MTTNFTRGDGKLYDIRNRKFLSAVSYQIHERIGIEGNCEKWWGELTFVDSVSVPDGDRYVIELEDKRKGRCSLSRRVNKAVILVPSRFFYLFQGSGPFE